MRQYLNLLQKVIATGESRPDRTSTGVRSIFGGETVYNMYTGNLPILTTKKINFHAVVTELLWFIQGLTNIEYLNDLGVHIWDAWANERGQLGPVYGAQWRRWKTIDNDDVPVYIDQLKNLVEGLKEDPYSRRHIVNSWNVGELSDMALPPCHCMFQMYVEKDGFLSCKLTQRSADIFLGVPFNITSYALLTQMIAKEVGLRPGRFIHSYGDLHLYSNHIDQAQEQLSRLCRPQTARVILPDCSLFDMNDPSEIQLVNYYHEPAIKAPISV